MRSNVYELLFTVYLQLFIVDIFRAMVANKCLQNSLTAFVWTFSPSWRACWLSWHWTPPPSLPPHPSFFSLQWFAESRPEKCECHSILNLKTILMWQKLMVPLSITLRMLMNRRRPRRPTAECEVIPRTECPGGFPSLAKVDQNRLGSTPIW